MTKPTHLQRGRPPRKIRVFVIDDSEFDRCSIRGVIERDPSGELEWAGESDLTNTNLIKALAKSRPDVVTVDIMDVRNDPVGLGTIGMIARGISVRGPKIVPKMLAFTGYPGHGDKAHNVGVDGVLNKVTSSDDDLRRAIKRVYDGKQVHSPCILKIIALRLDPSRLRVVLVGSHHEEEQFRLQPADFTFLHYLASERQSDQSGWIEKDLKGEYQIRQRNIWEEIQRRVQAGGATPNRVRAEGNNNVFAQSRSVINSAAKPFIARGEMLVLGPRETKRGYSLVPTISRDSISTIPLT